MDNSASQLSIVIDSVSKALAEWTVTRHHETDPSLPTRFGDAWRARWVSDVHVRIRQLAQAVAVRSPRLFAETITWSRAAYSARAMPDDDLRLSLRCLRDVLVEELPPAASDTAARFIEEAANTLAAPPPPSTAHVPADNPHRELLLSYLEANLEGRRPDAEALIQNAADRGVGITELYLHVLQPALIEVGRMWHVGEISIADEHFTTATTEGILAGLRLRGRPTSQKNRTVVATGIGGDLHAIGIRMVADFFEFDGWTTIYLGANTPNGDLVQALHDRRADLLAVSVTNLLQLRSLCELVETIRSHEALGNLRIIAGGWPFHIVPELWQEVGADGSANGAADAVAVGNRLFDTD